MRSLTSRHIAHAMLAVSFIGFLDAAYLTAAHYLRFSPPCAILNGCDTVTTSAYAEILGIPVALMGALYYAVIFLALIVYLESDHALILKITSYFTVAGLLASIWFVSVQVFILGALCLYCLVSAVTSTLLFLFGAKLLYSRMV